MVLVTTSRRCGSQDPLRASCGPQRLVRTLPARPQVLRTLDLRSNAILRGGTEALARALGTNRRLTALDLADNKLRPEDGEVIGKALPQNAHLHELVLDHNLLGAPGAHSLAIGLRESSLRSLDLGFCLLGPVRERCQALPS